MNHDRSGETRCRVCGHAELEAARFGLLRCPQCGLKAQLSAWDPIANEKLEHEWFGEDYDPCPSVWVKWFENVNNRRTLRRLAIAGPPGTRLLEVGVGSGSLLAAARERGFDPEGCDLSPAICKRVEYERHLRVHCGSLASLVGAYCFDVVVMNHVLEHVNEPLCVLRDACRLLTPGGVLHLAVPNAACPDAALPGWNSYEPYHLLYFSPEALRRAVVSSGFVVEREETHESFSGWFLAVLWTLLGRSARLGPSGPALGRTVSKCRFRSKPLEHVYRLAMVGVGTVLWPLRKLQASLGRGDEIICLARRAERVAGA